MQSRVKVVSRLIKEQAYVIGAVSRNTFVHHADD